MILEVYTAMIRKLYYFWPNPADFWPPEENIALDFGRLAMRYNYFAYGEVSVGVGERQSRDLILLNNEDRWICQVELKLVNGNTIEAVYADLDRVRNLAALTRAITRFSKIPGIQHYRRYGLFVGGDIALPSYGLWQQVLVNHPAIYSGVVPHQPVERVLWLVYALFEDPQQQQAAQHAHPANAMPVIG